MKRLLLAIGLSVLLCGCCDPGPIPCGMVCVRGHDRIIKKPAEAVLLPPIYTGEHEESEFVCDQYAPNP